MSTLDHAPYGQTETGAAYTEAAARAETPFQDNDPAHLVGIAQLAMKQAIRLDDPTEAKRVLQRGLDRITPPAVTA